MRTILARELKRKFIETFSDLTNFSYEEGNPFIIKIGPKSYFVFLKNLSPAYFKKSPDVTRVQLPYSPHFSKIFKADIPFIILGYDIDNDVLVSWNPKKVRERLNAKSNVSLYSRESLQLKIKSNDFKEGYLSNGEKIVLFKRTMLPLFFSSYQVLFFKTKELERNSNLSLFDEPAMEINAKKLSVIKDKDLIQEISPLLKKNKVLEAVEVCIKFYKGMYKEMSFKDWFKIVKEHYQETIKQ